MNGAASVAGPASGEAPASTRLTGSGYAAMLAHLFGPAPGGRSSTGRINGMANTQENEAADGISVSHIVHTIRAYAPAILLGTLAVAVASFIVSLLLYLMAPAQRITTQQFRLDFDHAEEGKYPNGLKFSSAEITTLPTLLRVYDANHLNQFTGFNEFSRSIFVLESNAAYDQLAAAYQARLADPKLGPLDRDRLQREWEAKVAAISKNDYSLNYLRGGNTDKIPESLVRKVLSDILAEWAQYAIHEQHVLSYKLAVLSPNIVETDNARPDLIVSLLILRSKVSRVLENVRTLGEIPGAELARTPKDKMSLEEIRVRLEDTTRYRIEPLVSAARANGLMTNAPETLRFLDTQLAYDLRQLNARQDDADAIRQSLAVYTNQNSLQPEKEAMAAASPALDRNGSRQPAAETLMPQINDSFLDRIVAMTNQSVDILYRQKLADDFRRGLRGLIPMQQAVAYDREVIAMLRTAPSAGGSGMSADQVRAELAATQNEVRMLVGRVNEIYEQVSRNLNPSTELYTLTAPPTAHTERTRNLKNLAMYDLLAVFIALPIIIVLCLLHARVREEEQEEGYTSDIAAT
ncbi:MAG: hypothetical protein QOI24_3445 [Acidobacteriota bacterium]|nr:hypothetical protein [Acidobacteriota bacterium]